MLAPNVPNINGGSCKSTSPWQSSHLIPLDHSDNVSVDYTQSSTFVDILPGNFFSGFADSSTVSGDYFTDQFTVAGVTVNNLQVSC